MTRPQTTVGPPDDSKLSESLPSFWLEELGRQGSTLWGPLRQAQLRLALLHLYELLQRRVPRRSRIQRWVAPVGTQ
jgi:hypothetical protein